MRGFDPAKGMTKQLLNRRQLLGYSAAAWCLAAVADALPEPAAKSTALVYPTNPLGARAVIYTLVTPDLQASMRFYRDIMGYELLGAGRLGGKLPTLTGAGPLGRPYALIRTMDAGEEHGFLRLLEAPPGARPIRPHPGASIMDPGFAVIECMARSVDESYRHLTALGVETISTPRYYRFGALVPLAGAPQVPDFEFRSYSAYGPGGEQLFISSSVTFDHKPAPAWSRKGPHDGFVAGVLVSLDRWPVWDFYEAVFGLKPTRDTFAGQESINELIGAKPGSNYQFGMMGQNLSMEWWEYRDRPNPASPPFPTSLDHTGLAMSTVMVNDLAEVRDRVRAAGLRSIGEGALPTPDAPYQEGFYLRGPVGELIEIIGRPA